jgi:hypothetical protein
MALAGDGAICLWHDITAETRDAFYAWHTIEHMPERLGIPGFVRGRRYIAHDAATTPEIFAIYETTSFEVVVGQDYLNRLNAPTPWSTETMKGFRGMIRALARVRFSAGPGPGGFAGVVRFGRGAMAGDPSGRLLAPGGLSELLSLPQVTGVHLFATDTVGSGVKTNESKNRGDSTSVPDGALMIEVCNAAPAEVAIAAAKKALAAAGAVDLASGLYRLEHTRLKTAHTAG